MRKISCDFFSGIIFFRNVFLPLPFPRSFSTVWSPFDRVDCCYYTFNVFQLDYFFFFLLFAGRFKPTTGRTDRRDGRTGTGGRALSVQKPTGQKDRHEQVSRNGVVHFSHYSDVCVWCDQLMLRNRRGSQICCSAYHSCFSWTVLVLLVNCYCK